MTDPQAVELAKTALQEAWDSDDPRWPGAAMTLILNMLADAGRLLPPGGVKTVEKGMRRGNKIIRVGEAFPGRYIRDVITWPMVDDANKDNWPVYYGPWREHQT